MFCDPCLELPIPIDIDTLRKKGPVFIKEEEANQKRTELKVQTDYNVLPMFHLEYDELKTNLSIRHNEYLRCRWNKFVAERREGYPKVQLYTDFAQERIKADPNNHRLRLSGRNYDASNRPAPVPYTPDIRRYYYNLKHRRAGQ